MDSLAENDIMQYDFSAFADSMLIMHGTRDETVPIDAVRRFAEKNDLMLIEINGADHMFKDPARERVCELTPNRFYIFAI